MSKSFKEVLAEREARQWEEKVASVEEALGGDATALAIFDAAIDHVKEAGITDPNTVLDAAMDLTIEALTDEPSGEAEKVAEVDYEALGAVAAQVAHAAGITSDEVEKLASDEETEALGRLLAHCVYAELTAGE